MCDITFIFIFFQYITQKQRSVFSAKRTNTLAYRYKFIRVTVPRHSRRNRRTLLFAFIICFPKVRIPRPSCRNGKAISILNVVVHTGDNVDPRRSVHLHLIGTTRGSQRRKKREDRRARACLVFPILWTLDPLSPGFNFYPLPPLRHPALCTLLCLLVRLSPRGSSHVIRSRPADVFRHDARDNAAGSSL